MVKETKKEWYGNVGKWKIRDKLFGKICDLFFPIEGCQMMNSNSKKLYYAKTHLNDMKFTRP